MKQVKQINDKKGWWHTMKQGWLKLGVLAVVLTFICSVDLVAATTLKLQANVSDQAGGVLQGDKTVSVLLKNADDETVWEEPSLVVPFSEGIGLFELGTDANPFTRAILDDTGLHFVVTIDDVELTFPIIRYATPYALKSQYVEVVQVEDLGATFNIGAVSGSIVATQIPDELIVTRMVAPGSILNDHIVTLDVTKLSGDIAQLLETDVISSAQIQDGTLMNAELATGNFPAITGVGPLTTSLNGLSGLYVTGSVVFNSLAATDNLVNWSLVQDPASKALYLVDTADWDRSAADDITLFKQLEDVAIPTFATKAGQVLVVSDNEEVLVLSSIADLSVRNAETLDSLDSTDFLYANQTASYNTGVLTIEESATLNVAGYTFLDGGVTVRNLISTASITSVVSLSDTDVLQQTPFTFSNLVDTPDTFSGEDGKFLKVENGALVFDDSSIPTDNLILNGVIRARGSEITDIHQIGSVTINQGVITGLSSLNGITITETGEILADSTGEFHLGGVSVNEGVLTGVQSVNGVLISTDGQLTATSTQAHQLGGLTFTDTVISGLTQLNLNDGDLTGVGDLDFAGNLYADAAGDNRVGGVTFNAGVITALTSGTHQIGGVDILDGELTVTGISADHVTTNTLLATTATIAGVDFDSNELSNVSAIRDLTTLTGVVTINASGALALRSDTTHTLGAVSIDPSVGVELTAGDLIVTDGDLTVSDGDLTVSTGTLNVISGGPHRLGDWTFDDETLSVSSGTVTGLSDLTIAGVLTATSSSTHSLGDLRVSEGHLSEVSQISGVVTVNANGAIETAPAVTHQVGGLSLLDGEVRGVGFLGGVVTLNANGTILADASGSHYIGGVTLNSGLLTAQQTTGAHQIGAVVIDNAAVSGLTALSMTSGSISGISTLNVSGKLLAPGAGEHQLGNLRITDGTIAGFEGLSGVATINAQGILTATAGGDHTLGGILINAGAIGGITQLSGIVTVTDTGAIQAASDVAHSIGGVTLNAGILSADRSSVAHQIGDISITDGTLSNITTLDMTDGEIRNVSTFNFTGIFEADGSGTHTLGAVTINAGKLGDVTEIHFKDSAVTRLDGLDTLSLSTDTNQWNAEGLTISGLLTADTVGGHQVGNVVINQGAVSNVETLNGISVAQTGWSSVPSMSFRAGAVIDSPESISLAAADNVWSSAGTLEISSTLTADSTDTTHTIGGVTINQQSIGGVSTLVAADDAITVNGRFAAPDAVIHQLGDLLVNGGHLSELSQLSGVVTVNTSGAILANSTEQHTIGSLTIDGGALGSIATLNAGSVSTTMDVIGELRLLSDTHDLGGVKIVSGFLDADDTSGTHTIGGLDISDTILSNVTTINMTNGEITGLDDLSFSGAFSATSDDTHQIGDVQFAEGILSGVTQINTNISLTSTGVLTASATGIHQIGSVQFNASDITNVDSIAGNNNQLTVDGLLIANTSGIHQIGSLSINQGAISELTSITAKADAVNVTILSPLRANAAGDHSVGNVEFNNGNITSVDEITAEGTSVNIQSSLWADSAVSHNIGNVEFNNHDLFAVDQITAEGASVNIESSLWADAAVSHNVGNVGFSNHDLFGVDQIIAEGASVNIESSLWADAAVSHNVGNVEFNNHDLFAVDQITAEGASVNIESSLWADAAVSHNIGNVEFLSGAQVGVVSIMSTARATPIRFLSPLDADASGDHQVGNVVINDRAASGINTLTSQANNEMTLKSPTVNIELLGGSMVISSNVDLTSEQLGMLNLKFTDSDGLTFSDNANSADDHILLAIHAEEDDQSAGLEYLGGLIRTSATSIGIHSTGEDYAEMMERVNHADTLKAGDVVGVFSGKISHQITGADHIMVISTAPVVLGGMPLDNVEHYNRVAFLGQVPVFVLGSAQSGDYIVPSGKEDGTAVAVSPQKITRDQARQVFGQAWEDKSGEDLGTINVALLPGLTSKAIVDALAQENQGLKSTNDDLKTQIDLLRSDIQEIRYQLLESK